MNTPAYLLVRVHVRDWDAYQEYMKRTPRIIDQFGGRFIVRGSDPIFLEGGPDSARVAVIEFPSLERANAFFNSKEYAEVKRFREGAAEAQFILLEGYPLETWNEAVAQSKAIE